MAAQCRDMASSCQLLMRCVFSRTPECDESIRFVVHRHRHSDPGKSSRLAMWNFDGHDVRRLRRAIKDAKQGRYCRRLMTVLMVALGNLPGKVARLTGQARRTLLACRYPFL